MRSTKVPSCRFLFIHVVTSKGKRGRRRGKPLVASPYIADCQVLREQPFRSTTSDVSQVTERCNVDYTSSWHVLHAMPTLLTLLLSLRLLAAALLCLM